MSATAAAATTRLICMPVMPTDATQENPDCLIFPGLGSSQTGLCGPFLFPFRWTFQRRGGRRSWRRRAHRTMEAHLVPLFIEAVPPPVKALRGLLFNLAEGVRIHHELDLGEAFFTVFPPFGSGETEVVVDFLPVARIQAIGRDGSSMLLSRMARAWTARCKRARSIRPTRRVPRRLRRPLRAAGRNGAAHRRPGVMGRQGQV